MSYLAAFRRAALLLVGTACLAVGPPARAEIDPDRIREAIDRGVKWLKSEQLPKGNWTPMALVGNDTTSLCTLALLNAGVPPQDPVIQKAIKYILAARHDQTYNVALDTMVLCAAEPAKHLREIEQRASRLAKEQIKTGGNRGMWGYPGRGGDNSNTQFALLGLYEADRTLARFGVASPIDDETWRLALEHWTTSQNDDGSWGYGLGNDLRDPGTGSMTCAGIASVIICSGRLHGGSARIENGMVRCCGAPQEKDPVADALRWLASGRRFSVEHNPGQSTSWWLYYLYGLERAGRLTAQRFIGEHDWYREGAEKLVAVQDPLAGYWKGTNPIEGAPHIGTSFALLFLSKGRWPVIMAKVKYGPNTNLWSPHQHDVANLVQYVEQRWKKDLTWQVIDAAAAKADDYQLASVLYISGSESLPLAGDAAAAKELRAYIDRGGFIFADACCDDPRQFEADFQALMRDVFPEPEFQLRPLDPTHEVWFMEEALGPDSPYWGKLFGINVGCRTCVIYCGDIDDPFVVRPRGLSCFWELGRPGRGATLPPDVQKRVTDALNLGTNVLAYATNRNPKYKDQVYKEQARTARGPQSATDRWKLVIAKWKHSGGWNVAPGALPAIQRELNLHAGVLVPTDQLELDVTDERIFDEHVAFIHGRNAFSFSKEERAAIKKFVERGGTIFGDAVCASEAFARSFREEMKTIFEKDLEPIPATHAMFTDKYGGFDLATVKRRDPPRERGKGPLKAVERDVPPELDGLKFDNDRYGVIFSRYDLSCALESFEATQCRGYTRDDAARIAINVVLYSVHE
jgi:hypothetical protein